MIYKFRIISSEKEDFIREIAINSHATFLELNNCIVAELGYEQSQVTSFFLTDQNWHKELEITIIDMTEDQSSDILVMEKCKLGEYISEKKQRLLYVFDQFAERALFLELFEITDGETDTPLCLRRKGDPPPQFDETALDPGSLEDIELENLLNDNDFRELNDEDTENFDNEEDLF